MRTKTLPIILSIIGTLPYIYVLLYFHTNIGYHVAKLFNLYTNVRFITITYSSVILAFIAGINWGALSASPTSKSSYAYRLIYLWSGIVALFAWLLDLIGVKLLSLYLIIVAFAIQFMIDRIMFHTGSLPGWLYWVKIIWSVLVIITIIVVIVKS